MIFRIYRDEDSPPNNSHPRLYHPEILRRFVHYSQVPLSILRAFLIYEVSRRVVLREDEDATTGREVSTARSRLWRWTYQDSHFCSRDVPGASRSELDADCRRFLALYTRHTFAFATRGPAGSEASSRIPPRYTSLFSYDDDGPTVPSDHHSPLGQTPHSPSPTDTRAAKKHLSFFNEWVFVFFLLRV